ncbi:MAG: hypothetical protein R2941_03745 [Desulfobacterales bacterium]
MKNRIFTVGAKANLKVARICFENGFMMRVQTGHIMQLCRQPLTLADKGEKAQS